MGAMIRMVACFNQESELKKEEFAKVLVLKCLVHG
jgi:hypothetical protein